MAALDFTTDRILGKVKKINNNKKIQKAMWLTIQK